MLNLGFVNLDGMSECVFGVVVWFMGLEFLLDKIYLFLRFDVLEFCCNMMGDIVCEYVDFLFILLYEFFG